MTHEPTYGRAAIKRLVIRDALYELHRMTEAHNGLRNADTVPEDTFDDVLTLLNITIAKLDAVDQHPAGRPNLEVIK
jgi:hypothetical protein